MSEWKGKEYKSFSSAQKGRALQVLEEVSFDGDEIVLDIGCGSGDVTREIASRVPNGKAIGIDISHNMIEEALKDISEEENLSFYEMGAEDFSFSEKFDLVTSFNALHWVDDHKAVLVRVQDQLKDGGKFLFLMASGKPNPVIDDIMQKDQWKHHIGEVDKLHARMKNVDYSILIDEVGLINEGVEIIYPSYRFENFEKLQQHFMTWLPFATDLSEEECNQLAGELAENVKAHNKDEQGIGYAISMLLVKGRKRSID